MYPLISSKLEEEVMNAKLAENALEVGAETKYLKALYFVAFSNTYECSNYMQMHGVNQNNEMCVKDENGSNMTIIKKREEAGHVYAVVSELLIKKIKGRKKSMF